MSNNETLFVGKPRVHLPSVNSTNLYAQELLAKSNPIEGTAISAAFQTLGKGQIGSKWYGESGKNVATSIILRPTFLLPQQQFKLSQSISLAIRETIEHFLPNRKVWIKWPNDIYVENKKVCGILIQNSISSKKIVASIIGVGINVNETNFPLHLPNATSLTLETGKSFLLDEIYPVIFQKIEQYYLKLRQMKWSLIQSKYLEHLYKLNQNSKFRINDESQSIVIGSISGTSDSGQLLLKINNQIRAFNIKEISFI